MRLLVHGGIPGFFHQVRAQLPSRFSFHVERWLSTQLAPAISGCALAVPAAAMTRSLRVAGEAAGLLQAAAEPQPIPGCHGAPQAANRPTSPVQFRAVGRVRIVRFGGISLAGAPSGALFSTKKIFKKIVTCVARTEHRSASHRRRDLRSPVDKLCRRASRYCAASVGEHPAMQPAQDMRPDADVRFPIVVPLRSSLYGIKLESHPHTAARPRRGGRLATAAWRTRLWLASGWTYPARTMYGLIASIALVRFWLPRPGAAGCANLRSERENPGIR